MPINVFERELRRIADPLSDETRKARKGLLMWSLIAITLTVGNLFPTEVTVLGLKITQTSKSALLLIATAVICYFLVSFVVYGAADATGWYFRQRSTEWEEDVANFEDYRKDILSESKLSDEDRQFLEQQETRLGAMWRYTDALPKYLKITKVSPYLSITRAALDFALPILCGLIALGVLANS